MTAGVRDRIPPRPPIMSAMESEPRPARVMAATFAPMEEKYVLVHPSDTRRSI